MHTLPFSNVDVLLGRHPGVDPPKVAQRLLAQSRGGYCFEHAQLFAAVLERLGYAVERRLGRVHSPTNTRTHMAVVVAVDGHRYLADPGFGFSVTGPIPLADGACRDEGDRRYTVQHERLGEVDGWRLLRDGELLHVTDALPVQPVDARTGHLVTSTDPESVFTRTLMTMRHTGAGHVTVTEDARTVRVPGRETQRTTLSPAETVEAVQELGIRLVEDEPARLQQRIEELRRART